MDRHVKWLRRRIVASVAVQTAGTFAVVAVLAFALVYWRSDEGPITSLLGAIVIAQLVTVARVGHALRNNPLNYVYMRNFVDRPFSYRVSRFNREEEAHPSASRLPGFSAVATIRDASAEPSPCFDVYHDPSRLVAASVSRASGSITLISSLEDGRIMVTDARVLPPHERLVMNLAAEDTIESIIDAHRRALSARPDVVELASSAHQVVLDSLALEHESYVALGPALSPFLDLEPSGRWGLRLVARIDPEELAGLPATIGRDSVLPPRSVDGSARPSSAERTAARSSAEPTRGRSAQGQVEPVVPIVSAPQVVAPQVAGPEVATPDVSAPQIPSVVAPVVAALPMVEPNAEAAVVQPVVAAPAQPEVAQPVVDDGVPSHGSEPIVTGTGPVPQEVGVGEASPAVTAGTADRNHALVIEAVAPQPTDGRRPTWISPEPTVDPVLPTPSLSATPVDAPVPEAETAPGDLPAPVAPWVRSRQATADTGQPMPPTAPVVDHDADGPSVGPSPWVARDGDDPDVHRVGEPITADVPIVFPTPADGQADASVAEFTGVADVPIAPTDAPVAPVAEFTGVAPTDGQADAQVAEFTGVAPADAPVAEVAEPLPVPLVSEQRPATLAEAIVPAPDSPAALEQSEVRYRESATEQHLSTAGVAPTSPAATLGPNLSAALGYEDQAAATRPRLSAVLRANSSGPSAPGKRRKSR